MKIAPLSEMKARFSAYLKESEEGPIVVTRNGRPVAVLLAVSDDDELERIVLAYSPKYRDVIAASRKQIRETGGVAHDTFWEEMEAETQG